MIQSKTHRKPSVIDYIQKVCYISSKKKTKFTCFAWKKLEIQASEWNGLANSCMMFWLFSFLSYNSVVKNLKRGNIYYTDIMNVERRKEQSMSRGQEEICKKQSFLYDAMNDCYHFGWYVRNPTLIWPAKFTLIKKDTEKINWKLRMTKNVFNPDITGPYPLHLIQRLATWMLEYVKVYLNK